MSKSETFSIKPLGDRIVVKPLAAEEVSVSGIILPPTEKQESSSRGLVVAVGLGKYDDGKLVPMTTKAGDVVLFSKNGFDDVKSIFVGGFEHYILSESNVLAIITK